MIDKKTVTFSLPGVMHDTINKMIVRKVYPSRSELVRAALQCFLFDELELVTKLLGIELGDEDLDKLLGIDEEVAEGEKKRFPMISSW